MNVTAHYRPALITFLRTDGLSRLVTSDQDATAALTALSRLRSFSDGFYRTPSQDLEQEFDAHSIVISENIVRLRFLDTGIPSGPLRLEILSMIHMQCDLINDDIFLQGGIAIGDVCLDGNMVFGPGLNLARDVFSQFSGAPRINIDTKTLLSIRNDERLITADCIPAEEIQAIRNMVHRGYDGLWFIDYLYGMPFAYDFGAKEVQNYHTLLEKFRTLIVRKLRDTIQDYSDFNKYLSLAVYFNDVLARTRVMDTYITREDVPEMDNLSHLDGWTELEESSN